MSQLLRLWPYLRRHRAAYLAGLALVTLGSLLAVATPFIIKAAVDRLEGAGARPRGSIGLFALALACDRIYMLDLPDSPDVAPTLQLSPANFGWFPAVNHLTRLQTRFYEDEATIAQLQKLGDSPLRADQALELGLVTLSPDDIDWDDEIRIMLEERASLSPDAMTGMEASLRFPGKETMETRVFGRLSAWQNWIFIRPNAVGEDGALKLFGTGKKAKFDWKRI